MDFAVTADTVKIKENKKRQVLVRELKKLCNMRVAVIPVGVGTLGMVSKDFEELEVSRRLKTI